MFLKTKNKKIYLHYLLDSSENKRIAYVQEKVTPTRENLISFKVYLYPFKHFFINFLY